MATPFMKTFKVKYIANHVNWDSKDNVLYNEGKFVVNANSIEDAIEIVKHHADKILGKGSNVFIVSVKPEV